MDPTGRNGLSNPIVNRRESISKKELASHLSETTEKKIEIILIGFGQMKTKFEPE
ncbi:hypothetical protein HYC85_000559 [Camellia sinensis]|uniref:Uncharacterized protein n=1 Tax=Camellia sinensis TaxID=4442 RepID=A0A7J7I2V5_CAMSI|nr:hypothetical protein HYC85_000559 [Camellia sinensis]